MRVVAGEFRGRSLVAPPGRVTRPITDRVKENLFNILGHRTAAPGVLPLIDVLDVFSGPGSLGIEALSRGAATCTFVERDRAALAALQKNIAALRLAARTHVRAENAWQLPPPPAPGGAGFGLITLDPPFRDADEPARVAALLDRLAPALAADGVIVLRHEATAPPPTAAQLRTLMVERERVYGRMRLVFFALRTGTPSGAPG